VNAEGMLSIAGPALTTAGAGLLAYDVFGGPGRLLRDRLLNDRLDAAGEHKEEAVRSLDEHVLLQSTGERRAHLAAVEEQHTRVVARVHATRANDQDRERARAYWLAVWGLSLVVAGGVAETIAAVLAQATQR
jgi:hypothetical protein